ncbi:partial glycine cleavage system H protein, partial [Anaerolineae bacterium]
MDYSEARVDKFVFRVARDYSYSDADVWAKREGNRVRVGLTDYLQQKSGDV